MRRLLAGLALVLVPLLAAQDPAHVVFLIGEQEYGSEVTMPAFARRLERELGLRVTLLQSGEDRQLPALQALDSADLLVMFVRFREASDDQFARLRRWFDDGKPCVALRTTSHAFVADKGWFPPFFGGHYKAHAPNGQGTISAVLPAAAEHPILRGIPASVEMGHGGTYNAQPLADTATPLLLGRTGRLPCEPIAWVNEYRPNQRIFYTSLGSRENFERAACQQLLGNAVLWALGRELPPGGAFGDTQARAAFRPAAAPPPPALAAPAGATVLFDGTDTAQWRHWDPSIEPRAIGIDGRADSSSGGEAYDAARWPVVDGALVARPGFGDLVSRAAFGDYHLHVDFLVPQAPAWLPAEFRGHSGIYLAGRYEIQIADSFGAEPDAYGAGAVTGQHAPAVNAAAKAGTWQSLDVHVRHLQDERPRVSAWLNGRQIHDRVRLRERTVYGFRAEEAGARSLAKGEGLRHVRAAGDSFRFGTGEFTIAARFAGKGDGTIASKCPPSGKWQPNSKALFLRGGRLVYDIGWVGQMQSQSRFDDGKWHRVVLTHRNGEARLFVDGQRVAARPQFTADDDPDHVFKIGAAAPDFGGVYAGQISDVTVWQNNVPDAKARQWTRGETIHMGTPALAWQPAAESTDDPADDPAPPERVVVTAPIRLQADSSPVRFANIWLQPLAPVDHRGLLQAADRRRGEHFYRGICSSCHRDAGQSFAAGLQRGDDPLAIYRSLATVAAHRQAIAWTPPAARYDIVRYLRHRLGLPAVDEDYLATLPRGMSAADPAAAMQDDDWPPYRRMDYGNALHWTYEVAAGNIAQKGLAVRLDAGPGGVSRGRTFLVYDLDTMRVAAAWSGAGFVDWRGVAFDGSHNSHARIVGDTAFVNPIGPGWAHPETGSFEDDRLVGRDGRRFGPLAADWVRYRGRSRDGLVIDYTVGDALVREMPAAEDVFGTTLFTRQLQISARQQAMRMRIAPTATTVTLALLHEESTDQQQPHLVVEAGFHVLQVPASADAFEVRLTMTSGDARLLALRQPATAASSPSALDAPRPAIADPHTVTTELRRGEPDGAYAVDVIPLPPIADSRSHSWMRLGGVDFFADGRRAAVSTWNGDVWLVDGIGEGMQQVRWTRIASGLFQPLGVKIVDGVVYVGCRDQICALEDTDGDGRADFYRCFNNDHQVTEHFHEFAMGLQTDADGNFYYAKSARHAKPALVPHHGTLLKVAADGSRTEIVANGFRAANGICVNADGTFYVTDQEGHWTPKNRINRVVPGGFYGNMMGYHDRTSSADEDMQQPLCWLTNGFDRSPAELLRVPGDRWGLPAGSLLQLSYGMGQIFLVLEDEVDGTHQGGMVALPIEPFPTGIMRGRFHPGSGQLYCCGLYGWSGARTRPGGLYRVRYVGGEIAIPTAMHAVEGGLELTFATPLARELAEDVDSYGIRTWSLRRTKNYGSKHHDTKELAVDGVRLAPDGRTVRLTIPALAPTMCLEVRCDLETVTEQPLRAVVHGTLHAVR